MTVFLLRISGYPILYVDCSWIFILRSPFPPTREKRKHDHRMNAQKSKQWWINPLQQFREIHFLFLEIQCGGCYSISFLVCLDPVWSGEWASLGHAHPQMNCWKAKVLALGKERWVCFWASYYVFLWIQVKANVAEKIEDTSALWDRSHRFNTVLCL